MPHRRVSVRLRTGVLLAGVVAGFLLLAAVPEGQQVQSRGKSGQIQAPPVPTISVPRVTSPTIAVPDATKIAQASAAAAQAEQPWIDPARLRSLIEARRRGLNYLPGEVLVKFKDGVGADGQTRALQVLGTAQAADTLEWAGRVAIVRDETQPDAFVLADRLKSQPEVEYAEPNYIVNIDPADWMDSPTPAQAPKPMSRPNRGGTSSNVAMIPNDSDYVAYQWNFQLIGMPGAWDIQPGGRSDVIVAVIDSGITGATGNLTYPIWNGSSFQTVSMPYAPNPDLPASRQYLPKDFASKVAGLPLVDLSGHGTHVSATIGEATNNAFLVSGMAYNVQIMPLKVCVGYWDVAIAQGQLGLTGFPSGFLNPYDATCDYASMASAIDYAVANGARVMNISIGGGAPSSNTLQNALANAASKGAFISISMGNDFNKGNPTNYPAFYAASIDGVMSVAAVGPNSTRADYSSTGLHCEIAAPGGDALGNSGRVDGGFVWQSAPISTDHALLQPTARFDRFNRVGLTGTSMAAPHVAGLAALLMSQDRSMTGAQVEKIIKMTARDLGAVGKDESFGYGLIQPRAALFGYGIRR